MDRMILKPDRTVGEKEWAKKSCALIPLRRDGHGVVFIILRQNNVSSISVAKHKKSKPIGLDFFIVPQAQHHLRGTRNII